jgi:hypothetical protein
MTKTPTYTLNATKAHVERLKAQGFKYKKFLVNIKTDEKLTALASELGCTGERVLIEHFKD